VEKLVRSIAFFCAKAVSGDRVKFSTNRGQLFHRFFHRQYRIRWHRKCGFVYAHPVCTGASLKDCGYYLRFKGGDAPYAMSECVKRGSSFAADNVNSIAQLTQSLSQIRVSVPQLSNFFATVKHSRVIFATEHFANFRQTQTSMLPN